MSEKLLGCDMSHWNDNDEFCLKGLCGTDFVILKATEGATYFDPTYLSRAKQVLKADKLLGFYHYARPEKNTAKKEANNFIMRVKQFKEKCIVALDWEGNAVKKDYGNWMMEWLETVKKELNTAPFIYVSYAEINREEVQKALSAGYPLWVAKWGAEPRCDYTIWQFTNNPFDKNYFKGTINDFKEHYGRIENDAEGSGYCGCCCGCCAKGKQE